MIFGFKDNKCKGKVYTQEEVDNLLAGKSGASHTHAEYKVKGDFAVVEVPIVVSPSNYEDGEVLDDTIHYCGGNETVNLPNGFTVDNCVVIYTGYKMGSDTPEGKYQEIFYKYINGVTPPTRGSVHAVQAFIGDPGSNSTDNILTVEVQCNSGYDGFTIPVKVVLMKI